MEVDDRVIIYTGEYGLKHYLFLVSLGYRQACDYFVEIFIVKEDDPEVKFQRRDIDKAVEGKSHDDKCALLIKEYTKIAKDSLLLLLRESESECKSLTSSAFLEDLKEDSGEWLSYLCHNPNTGRALRAIRARSYSDILKSMLVSA